MMFIMIPDLAVGNFLIQSGVKAIFLRYPVEKNLLMA